MKTNIKAEKRERLHKKIRSRVTGTAETPRLAVFRSNRYMYAQLIDDVKGVTLASASDLGLNDKMTKLARATKVGEKLAIAAKDKKITTVVFDRGGFSYRGRVQALADGARSAGLVF
ncbi:MAG: 50S ribosomal protein L18 [Candidatus Nomurabacteria bacterium]|nr:50S ribosomal protein L18 [Candidatus Nomurabacteria bacterium]